MTASTQVFRDTLSGQGNEHLSQIRRGVEKEGLRVQADSAILSQAPHPAGLGSTLTHQSITTDYSEALLEFITPVSCSIEETLNTLSEIHRFTASHLDNEVIWGASMPCIVSGESGIPIANYGTSNVGTMKRVYRNGLGARYGRMMQAIAGIHYNFSMPEAFWENAWQEAGKPGALQDYKTDGYLGLIRNFFSRVWLLIYLTGASPAVCASFLAGNSNHHLKPFDAMGNSLHLPKATSLRMGDLGYNSSAQSSLQICYNSLENYIRTLHQAIVTPHPGYADYKTTAEGEQAQLSDSLLQIENEFYSPIRPKRVTRSGEAPLVALQRAGIEYIEVRCLDVNPYLPLGIDATTIRFVDAFLLDCLLSESPLCDDESRNRDKENLRRVVDGGREPGLMLNTATGEASMASMAQTLMLQIADAAQLLDRANGGQEYKAAVDTMNARLADPDQTPSGQILQAMSESNMPFWRLAQKQSQHWRQQFLAEPLDYASREAFEAETIRSLAQQRELETCDSPSFEDYLAAFFAQYQEISV